MKNRVRLICFILGVLALAVDGLFGLEKRNKREEIRQRQECQSRMQQNEDMKQLLIASKKTTSECDHLLSNQVVIYNAQEIYKIGRAHV